MGGNTPTEAQKDAMNTRAGGGKRRCHCGRKAWCSTRLSSSTDCAYHWFAAVFGEDVANDLAEKGWTR